MMIQGFKFKFSAQDDHTLYRLGSLETFPPPTLGFKYWFLGGK